MSGWQFGVAVPDPVSGRFQSMQSDIDWNIADAVTIADVMNGTVVAAPRGPWQKVPDELLDVARDANHERRVEEGLRRLLEQGDQQ